MSTVLWTMLAVVLVIALVVAVLVVVGRRAMQRQRAILEDARRRGGAAYLCLPTLGQQRAAMATLTVDGREIRVVRQGAEPVLIASLRAAGSAFEVVPVRVNIGATVDGVRITAIDGAEVRAVLYPDPTLRHTKPLRGAELADAIGVLRAASGRPGG